MLRPRVTDMLMHVRPQVLQHFAVDRQTHLSQNFSVSRVCSFSVHYSMFCFNIRCCMR